MKNYCIAVDSSETQPKTSLHLNFSQIARRIALGVLLIACMVHVVYAVTNANAGPQRAQFDGFVDTLELLAPDQLPGVPAVPGGATSGSGTQGDAVAVGAVPRSLSRELIQDGCWQRPHVQLLVHKYCGQLNDEGRARIAIAITNCHLEATGIQGIPCDETTPIKECTMRLGTHQVAFVAYTTFYAQVDSMCFYMRRDLFQRSTTAAVDSLLEAAFSTAGKLQTLRDNSQTIIESLNNNHAQLDKRVQQLLVEETKRFNQLTANIQGLLSTLETFKDIQKGMQESLSNSMVTQEVIRLATQDIQGRQEEALASLGKVDSALIKLQLSQSAAFLAAENRLTKLDEQSQAGFNRVSVAQAGLERELSVASERLAALGVASAHLGESQAKLIQEATALANGVREVKEEALGALVRILRIVSELKQEVFSVGALLFFPLLFLGIFAATCSQRSFGARGAAFAQGVVYFATEQGFLRARGGAALTWIAGLLRIFWSTMSVILVYVGHTCAWLGLSSVAALASSVKNEIDFSYGSSDQLAAADIAASDETRALWIVRACACAFIGFTIIREAAYYEDPFEKIRREQLKSNSLIEAFLAGTPASHVEGISTSPSPVPANNKKQIPVNPVAPEVTKASVASLLPKSNILETGTKPETSPLPLSDSLSRNSIISSKGLSMLDATTEAGSEESSSEDESSTIPLHMRATLRSGQPSSSLNSLSSLTQTQRSLGHNDTKPSRTASKRPSRFDATKDNEDDLHELPVLTESSARRRSSRPRR